MYTAISLFSGAMGLDIGLEQTGRFRLLACIEKEAPFRRTIIANRDAGRIGNRDLIVCGEHDDCGGDVTKVDPHKLMSDLGLKPGALDLLVGGPPCQSFSTTGRRRTVQDHRGTMLWQFLRFVEAMQPKMFLLENVRGLMSAALRHRPIAKRPERGGLHLAPDEQPGSVVQQFLHDLNDAYRVDCFEVNAVNYGAPQLRERAIFIGNRFNQQVEFPAPTHGPNQTASQGDLFAAPASQQPYRTLGDALQGLEEHAPVLMDFSPRKKRYLGMVPPGGNWRCLPEDVAKESMGRAFSAKGGRSGWWRRLSFDLPCPTIVTMPNHASTSLCHPTEVRVLTLRECARVQEFPEDWEFYGTTSQQYAQVGNAVPVRLGLVSGRVIASALDSLYASKMARSAGDHPLCRVVYVRSHVRTRQWFKDGQLFVWRDGENNDANRYKPPRTERREAAI